MLRVSQIRAGAFALRSVLFIRLDVMPHIRSIVANEIDVICLSARSARCALMLDARRPTRLTDLVVRE